MRRIGSQPWHNYSTYSLNIIPEEHIPPVDYDDHEDTSEPMDRRGWTASTRTPPSSILTTRSGSAHNLNSANGSYNGDHDDSSPHNNRLANFLSKPFRTNPLKRTKSVSKLEKQQQQSQMLNRVDAQRSQENLLSLTYGSRALSTPRDPQSLRSSRSHESLLNFGAVTHMIDLGDGSSRIQAVHPSMHDVPNCFRVANTYYACRTTQERNRWMENLNRIVNPRLDMQRRVEHSLQLWVLEAKGVPSKKKYFCEFSLDREAYGKTTSKPRTDNVFWGEFFEFNMLRQNKMLIVDLYREGDLKKKKGTSTLIGYVKIDIDQIASRHPVERWYTVTTNQDSGNRLTNALTAKSTPAEQPAIRIKARWQSVDILPLAEYDDLKHFLTYNYEPLCTQLEPILSVKTKEDLATSMVRVFHEQKMAKDFLTDLVMMEINLLDNDHLMFRGNSLATKAMEAYMKLVADDYLQETLADFTKELIDNKESCEVDPLKLTVVSSAVLEKNRSQLMKWVEKAWYRMYDSSGRLPCELKAVFCTIRDRLQHQGREELADTLISSSIFLRYLCPAILSPSLFNLCDEYPCGTTARNLTLIAKTLQNLANFTKFGGKEHYMEFMNSFVEREWHRMKDFLSRISSGPVGRPTSSADVNVGRELSLINLYLEESWTADVHERACQDSRLVDMRRILVNLRERKRGGSLQSPLVHQASSDYENSPNQPVIRGRSENVPAYRSTPPSGQATVITRSRPAMHLMTSDDYVASSALSNNHRLVRLSDEVGTSSSRTSEKTSSSGDAHDTDSEGELRTGRQRTRKPKRKVEGSETGSLPPSSGYHSKEASNYSTSASSSPVERTAAVSIANPAFSPMKEGTEYGSYQRSTYEGYRRASPPPYDPERMSHNYSIYAVPPDCDTSPRTSKVLPRTNPRASRSSTVLRPTIVDIDVNPPSHKVEKSNSEVDIIEKQRREIERLRREKDEVEEQQKREIRRLMKENAELKRQMTETVKYSIIPIDKISDSGASEESYDSLSSLDRVRNAAVHC